MDGDPKPPGDGLRGTSAGAASRSTNQNASGGALAERDCGGMYRNTVAKTRLSAALSPLCTGDDRAPSPWWACRNSAALLTSFVLISMTDRAPTTFGDGMA